MIIRKYILNKNGESVPCDDLVVWAQWFEHANRMVKETYVGDLCVSTVFLGLDHNWDEGPPIFWETMVFDQKREEVDIDRCAGNREQAEAMHELMVIKYERAIQES
jgi:hypothetical protein